MCRTDGKDWKRIMEWGKEKEGMRKIQTTEQYTRLLLYMRISHTTARKNVDVDVALSLSFWPECIKCAWFAPSWRIYASTTRGNIHMYVYVYGGGQTQQFVPGPRTFTTWWTETFTLSLQTRLNENRDKGETQKNNKNLFFFFCFTSFFWLA